MEIEFLGSSSSTGVPEIGCDCVVCRSTDPRDARFRPSILLRQGELCVAVDTPQEFRLQCLRAGVRRLDAILMTHLHADHIFGMDDVRKFNRLQEQDMPIYLPAHMIDRFRQVFHYTLQAAHSNLFRPKLDLRLIGLDGFDLAPDLRVQPLDVQHSDERIFGYLFTTASGWRVAYLTDCKSLSADSETLVRAADVMILGALWTREWQHPGHLNLREAIAYARHLEARRTYFTHLTHYIGPHAETQATLPTDMALAYDGLVIREPRG